jgi:hypothetical protein
MTSKGLSNKRIIKNFEPYWQKTRFSKINNTKLCALVAKKINSCLNYASNFKFKIIAEIIASANSADEVNSIASQAFEQRLLEEMNESRFRSRKRGR